MTTYLIVCSSAPTGKLGRVGDMLLEAVGSEGSEAYRCCAVDSAYAPVRSRRAAAHVACFGCDQQWCRFVLVGHSGCEVVVVDDVVMKCMCVGR